MRFSSSSVLGFSTFGADGPSPPPPPPGAGIGGMGLVSLSGIAGELMVQLNELGKWELQQIFDGARGGNGHQALADLSQAEQASQVEFNQAAGAAERDVIPLGGFN